MSVEKRKRCGKSSGYLLPKENSSLDVTVEDNVVHEGKLNSNLFPTSSKENSTGIHFCPGLLNCNSMLNPVSQYSLENKISSFYWTENYQLSTAPCFMMH